MVGRSIARDLVRNGHEVLIVESDPAVVVRQADEPGCKWFAGDACEVSTLHDSGFGEADVVVAATGDDEDNLVVSLLAKQEFAVPAGDRQGKPPQEQLAVQRDVGCRCVCVDAGV